MVFSPPSRYFQTARPGRIHAVFAPCGKSFGSGGGGDSVHDVAVYECVQVGADHHDAPGRGDGSGDGGGFFQPLDVFFIAQAERVGRRMRMTEPGGETTLAVCLQGHACVVCESAFGDRRVTDVAGKLDGHWRSGPLSGGDFRESLLHVMCFVVAFQIVIPDRAARGWTERSGLIGHAGACAGYLMPESDAIIAGHQREPVIGFGFAVAHGHNGLRAIHGGMGLRFPNRDTLREICAIYRDPDG